MAATAAAAEAPGSVPDAPAAPVLASPSDQCAGAGAGAGAGVAAATAFGGAERDAAAVNAAGLRLHDLVLSGAQDAASVTAAVELVSAVPGAAGVWKDGALPLHHAVTGFAAAGCLAVLRAHPAAAAQADCDGLRPLHSAALHNAPLEVVEALVEAWPQGTSTPGPRGWLPLTMALTARAEEPVCRSLLRAHPGAAAVSNPPLAGDTGENDDPVVALHAAVSSSLSDGFVCELLEAWPAAAGLVQPDGWLALHAAVRAHRDETVLDKLLDAFPEAVTHVGANGWTTLHACIFSDASPTFLERVLEAWPGAASHVAADSAGMPLHLALARMAPPDFVLRLLNTHPAAASVPVPCASDVPSYPLHVAARWGCSDEVVRRLLELHVKAAIVKGGDECKLPHKIAKDRGRPEMSAVILAAVEKHERRHACHMCRLPAKLRCTRCKGVWYCSRACQRGDWARHKPACAARGAGRAGDPTPCGGAASSAGGGEPEGGPAAAAPAAAAPIAPAGGAAVEAGPGNPVDLPAPAFSPSPGAGADGAMPPPEPRAKVVTGAGAGVGAGASSSDGALGARGSDGDGESEARRQQRARERRKAKAAMARRLLQQTEAEDRRREAEKAARAAKRDAKAAARQTPSAQSTAQALSRLAALD